MRKTSSPIWIHCCVTFILAAVSVLSAQSENWPQWRGPRNNGTSLEKNLVTSWSKTENVKWRLPLPGAAASTPIVWNDRIFLTSADGSALVLLTLNTGGKTLWQQKLDDGNVEIRAGESNPACPSPSTDGEHVWAFVGSGMLTCFDFEGNRVWEFDVQERYQKFNMYWGMSTSPLLDGDRLYLLLLHSNAQVLVALDKRTGKERWQHQRRTDARQECRHAYTSPILYRHAGQAFLVAHGTDYTTAHSLSDGSELWRTGGYHAAGNYNPSLRFVASPVAAEGLIVTPSAKNGPVFGINPAKARGDITGKPEHFHWQRPQNTPDVPSPLIHDGLVYLCRENATLICLDAQSGEEYYMERTHDRRHRGSPVYADGKIFLMAADGTVTVVKAGKKFSILATNSVEERLAASLAISNGTIYLRSYEALYAIANGETAAE